MTTPATPSRRRGRLIAILMAGLLVISGAVAYVQFWLARPIGTGPAGPAVELAAFEQVWTERPVLLLGVGDSITAGLGASTPEHSYFQRLIENSSSDFADIDKRSLSRVLPNLQTLNLAVSGSTSIEHLRTVIDKLPQQEANVLGVVVMTSGGNDIIHSYGRAPPREGAMYGATLEQAEPWIKNYEERLNTMLDLLNERFPGGCHVFLADIYDPTDGVGDAPSVFLPNWPAGLAIHTRYNEVIRRCCDERPNVHFVPLHATFLGHGSHCRQFWRKTYCADDPHYWYYENIEDPNDRGYDAIRRIYLLAMADVLAPATP